MFLRKCNATWQYTGLFTTEFVNVYAYTCICVYAKHCLSTPKQTKLSTMVRMYLFLTLAIHTYSPVCSNLSSPANGYVTLEGTTEGSVAITPVNKATGYLGWTRGLVIRMHNGRELSHAVWMVSSNTIQCL